GPFCAYAVRHPSRRFAAPRRRCPDPWFTECRLPDALPRPATQPWPRYLDPTTVSRPRQPALCLSAPGSSRATAEAELFRVDRSTLPTFAPATDQDKGQSAQRENPVG